MCNEFNVVDEYPYPIRQEKRKLDSGARGVDESPMNLEQRC
jgi:hypothetical protein